MMSLRKAVFVPALAIAFFFQTLLAGQQPVTQKRMGDFEILTRAPCLAVLNQGNTGTCWSFATTSFMESEVLRILGHPVDLSEMYVVRCAVREKARRYVMLGGKAVFGQGGLSHDVIAMIKRYGILPAESYPGLRKGQKQHDHTEMFTLVKTVLDKLVETKPSRRSRYWEDAVMGIVDSYLGRVPLGVPTKDGVLSPQQYAKNVLRLPLDDYVEVMSYSYVPFHEKGELLVPDNWLRYDGYLNLPIDEFMAGMINALEKGYTVAADMDVSEKGFDSRKGVARLVRFWEERGITQADRDEMFRTGSTTDDHLMHVVGLARGPKGGRYFLTKNSWGEKNGPFGGFIFISEAFMRAKTLAYMVHKDGLPKSRGTDN